MTPFEMGRVSAFLERHRKIEEKSERRQVQREEKDLAAVLRDASLDAMEVLQELLRGKGFRLMTLNSFELRGIPTGARVHLLVREAGAECLQLDTSTVVAAMDPGTGRATAAKIWFSQIWLIHMDLLYSQRDRGPAERGSWLEATFSRTELLQAVREHVNGFVRRLDASAAGSNPVYQTMTSEKGTDLERYVNRFLTIMTDQGMLDELDKGIYRQSMLSAVEMKENYDRALSPFVVDDAPLSHAAESILTDSPAEFSEGVI